MVTPEQPTDADLVALGLLDPGEPDADDRAALVRMALARGATIDEVRTATNLGELALDLTLRPRSGQTLRDVVDATGVPWRTAERLLTATGLRVEPDRPVSEAEADTVRLLTSLAPQLLGEEATVQLGRVAGGAMARVAEAVVTAFRLRMELPRRSSGAGNADVVDEYTGIVETVLPAFVRSLDVLLRQQILAVAERVWATDDEQSVVTLPRAVGFADIVGYTATAAAMSARELTDVLVAFDELTATAALRGNGRIVKTIGDEAMFVTDTAADACRIALDLVGAFGTGRLPPIRVGLAVGDVVSVFGDVYGPDVNLAARLVAVAAPSTVVVSEAVATACGDDHRFEALPAVALKGLPEPVTPYRLLPPDS